MPASNQRIRQIPDEPLATAPLLGPENMAGKRNSDGARIYGVRRRGSDLSHGRTSTDGGWGLTPIVRPVRALLSGLLGLSRRLQLKVWAARAKTRMKWVGIRLEVEVGEGVVLVRNPFVLAGVEPPGEAGSLTIRLGDRVRFAPGVIIEAEPGKQSVLEIGAGTRIGATTHFHLRGGSVRIGPGCEVRDGCVLKTTGGTIDVEGRSFMSYGCVLHSTEMVVMEERVVLAERVTLVDSTHETDGSDVHWASIPVPTAPVVVGANTVVYANAVLTMGTHIGPNSQVAAGAVVRGEYPGGVLLAGAPAEVVKTLGDD
jgi:acetyltransferase-like isoleucine patch superfamily enzyme